MGVALEWLPVLGAALFFIAGIIGFFRPTMITSSVKMDIAEPEATAEARSLFGGLFMGLAFMALILDQPVVYLTLGVGIGMAIPARCYAIFADSMTVRATIPALIFDGVLASLLLSGGLPLIQ